MPRPRRGTILLVAALILAGSGSARAGAEDAAGQAFERGLSSARRGDHAGAARAFDESLAILPHPKTLVAASLEWERAGRDELAATRLTTLLARTDVQPADRAEAQRRLAALDAKLSIVKVTAPAGSIVEAGEIHGRETPAELRVPAGRVVLFVTLPGGHVRRFELQTTRGETTSVVVEGAETIAPVPSASTTSPPPDPPPIAPPTATAPPSAPTSSSSRATIGIVFLAGGAVAAAAGTYLGLSGLAARDRFRDSPTDADARDVAIRNRTLADVAFVGGALLGGVGAYLSLSTPDVSVSAEGAGVRLRGRF